MAYGRIYTGSFYSIRGTVWSFDILRSDAEDSAVEVTPAAEPLFIEWPEKGKHEPVRSSAATLKLISASDRQFIDLYSIAPGEVRLDVYRDGSLFWSGTLDTELYEEPYSTEKGYVVTLTFSDFGPLDRLPFALSGVKTLRELVEAALAESCISYVSVDESLISTTFDDGTALALSSLSVPSSNFYDEDGEASSWLDVLEGILQPLALIIVQRAGKIWIFDLNGLVSGAETSTVDWRGTDAELGTDAVYNNVKVTFSPYASGSAIAGDLDYGDTYGPEWTNLTSDASGVKYLNGTVPSGVTAPECYSWYLDYDESHRHGTSWDYSLIGFTLFRSTDSTKCTGLSAIGSYNCYFKIVPALGGSESEGVAEGFYTGGHGSLSSGYPVLKGISPEQHNQTLALTTERSYLPPLSDADRARVWLRIRLPLLFDPRYNPFESEGDGNESGNYDSVKTCCQTAFVPVSIVVYDADGNALCHYDNRWLTEHGAPGSTVAATAEEGTYSKWGWADGEAEWGDAWLSYYDPDDIEEGCGVLGWKTNRQSFGEPIYAGGLREYQVPSEDGTTTWREWWIFDSFRKLPEGQYIPYPPQGGYLEVRVYNGVWAFADGEGFATDASGTFADKGLYSKIRWQLIQAPSVDVVARTTTLESAQADDVEYTGVVNEDAKEGLDIDTVCGTSTSPVPTARGIYRLTSDGSQVTTLTRAGRTDHPEQLLIGTLYSQHAERMTTLSGTALLDSGSPCLWKDAAQEDGVRFTVAGENMNLRMDTTDATYVETRPDEWTGKEA